MQSRKSDNEEYGEIIAPGTYELKWLREPHHVKRQIGCARCGADGQARDKLHA